MRIIRRAGERATIEGTEAVATGRPLRDYGVRWHGGYRGVHGFYAYRVGVCVDRLGFTLAGGEWHLARAWRRGPTVLYWGDIASAELVDRAGGIDRFLAEWRRG